MRKKNQKLVLSKETLRNIAAGTKEGAGFGGGTGSCLTCYFSCVERCDTNLQCPAAD
jgi:hypothetical protein